MNLLWLAPVVGAFAADSLAWRVAWIAGGLAVYAGACAIWPFTSCRACDGTGRRTSPSGRNYGRCWRCRGTPERVRLGRRLFAHRPR